MHISSCEKGREGEEAGAADNADSLLVVTHIVCTNPDTHILHYPNRAHKLGASLHKDNPGFLKQKHTQSKNFF